MPCLPQLSHSLGLGALLLLGTPLSKAIATEHSTTATFPPAYQPPLPISDLVPISQHCARDLREGMDAHPRALRRNRVWGHGSDGRQPSKVAGGGGTGGLAKGCFVSVSLGPVRLHVVPHFLSKLTHLTAVIQPGTGLL